MKALCSTTDLAGLTVEDRPTPEPGPSEVRVRVAASAVNPADWKVLDGSMTGRFLHGKERPLIVGYDVAGTVEAAGPGADLVPGDEVYGFLPYDRSTPRGAFAECIVIGARCLAKRPADLSPAAAAALATSGATALQAFRDLARLKEGGSVLIVGAAGGVGSLAVGVAVAMGARVTAICGSSVADFVGELGAAEIVDRAGASPLRKLGQFDVILDAAAAHSWFEARGALRPGGAYVSTLPSAGTVLGAGLAALEGKRCGMVIVKPIRKDLEQLATWAIEGRVKVPIDSTFAVRDGRAAIERLQRGGMRGRVVVEVRGGW